MREQKEVIFGCKHFCMGVHFDSDWLVRSDWTVDLTHPRVDAEEGWQYATSFTEPEERWSAEPPPPLQRLLSGSGAMAVGLGGASSRSSSAGRSSGLQSWVRRRRWVRVMRRRLDIPPLPFLGPDGNMYQICGDGAMIPYVNEEGNEFTDSDGHEMAAMPVSNLSMSQDYVSRSRYVAGAPSPDTATNGASQSAVDTRRAIAKLERAVMELRMGMLGMHSHLQSPIYRNDFVQATRILREEPKRRCFSMLIAENLSANVSQLVQQALFSLVVRVHQFYFPLKSLISVSRGGIEEDGIDDDSDDEEFYYPGNSPTSTTTPRPPSTHSHHSQSTDYFNRPTISRTSTDLTPHLSQAPEFRVPTHETPQKVARSRSGTPTPHLIHAQWERDDAVSQCSGCKRRFTFLFRKVCFEILNLGEQLFMAVVNLLCSM